MQIRLPLEFTYIMIIIAVPLLIVAFLFYFKRDYKSIEFRVAAYILGLLGVMFSLLILATGTFQSELIPYLIVLLLGVLLMILTTYTITKIIRLNKESLEKVVSSSKQASINVSNMATELAASASEVNASAEEIASTTQEVSSGASNQVKKISDISKVALNVNNLAENVRNSSADIGKIMGIITNIAEQTNLLALNASIEAGRAGEHGRGFAVVADEVRKLAEESKGAVGSSNEKITDVIRQIEDTVNFIKKISNDIQEVLALSEETSAAMEEINSSAEEQTASMEEITATANKLGEQADVLKANLSKNDNSIKKGKSYSN